MRQINFIVTLGGSLLQRHRNELEPKERTQENSIINLSPTALSSIASCTLVEIHWIDSSCENRFTTLPPFLKIPHSSISSEVTMDVTEDEKKIATPRFDSHDFWVDGNSILM